MSTTEQQTFKRCQVILASVRGEHVPAIARQVGCDDQTIRKIIIQAFNQS